MELKVTETKNIARIRCSGTGRNRRWTPDRQFNARTRVYVSPKGETVLQNLTNRRDRPTADYRKAVVELYPDFKGNMTWSQTAGCGCGCSPAFILDRTMRNEDGNPIDVFLTVEAK